MLKRYCVFAFPAYYPGGGWTDFVGSFDDKQEALKAAYGASGENKQVIDLETGEDIYDYRAMERT